MIHVVFNEADIDVLQKAIELDETLQGEVLHTKEDFNDWIKIKISKHLMKDTKQG